MNRLRITFNPCTKKGKYLKKAPLDIMETIVSGLLPPVSKFVMLRSPQTLEQALDLALTASVLQQDSTTDKVEVALATITDKIGALQTNLNSIQSQTPLRRTPPARQFPFQRQPPQLDTECLFTLSAHRPTPTPRRQTARQTQPATSSTRLPLSPIHTLQASANPLPIMWRKPRQRPV